MQIFAMRRSCVRHGTDLSIDASCGPTPPDTREVTLVLKNATAEVVEALGVEGPMILELDTARVAKAMGKVEEGAADEQQRQDDAKAAGEKATREAAEGEGKEDGPEG